jgi:hypothetical protein
MEGVRHLSKEARFAALIGRIGPPKLGIQRQRSPYEALVRAIAHQQLHGRAAEAILGRFSALFPGDEFPRTGRGDGDGGNRFAGLRIFRRQGRGDPRYLRESFGWDRSHPPPIAPAK